MIESTERVHVGMEDASYEQRFRDACTKPGRFDMWNLVDRAQKGDMVLLYLQEPVSSFVGVFYVDSDRVPAPEGATRFKKKPWYHVRDAELLPNGPVSRRALKAKFPDWGFPRHPGVACFPNRKTSQEQLDELLDFLSLNLAPLCADEGVAEGLRNEIKVMAQKRNRPLRNRVLRAAKGVCEACETDYSKLLGRHRNSSVTLDVGTSLSNPVNKQ